ncbi:MAG TPA: thiamine pyrophosphate-dependent dehydrogenase E1 component subunit alpha [Streptosporangiaceae bacterium]|jgi:TPP-dependent pyruvate/acetoin dehydrogenase alpha subunit|nr:thiamine pyrophosphate-dependent dehydrogenase E1 component subunit alpha [Streptosporangiaceae bacterium]
MAELVVDARPTGPAPDPAPDPAELYRGMRLIRSFEECALGLVKSGEIVGGIHPYIGEEAVAVGVCAVLRPDDLITSTHRGHGHVLAKGSDPRRMLAELCGRATGLNRGRGGSMHAADVSVGILGANAIVGGAAPIAAGAAWAAKRAGADRVVATFFGDGALNQGVLLETMNLAALWALPLVFVCENNGYATTMATASAVAGTAAGRAAAFGLPSVTVDGMDVLAVHAASAAAVAAARDGSGPTFIEALTYRYGPHHTIEQRIRLAYRTQEEIDQWRQRDPLDVHGARIPPGQREQIDAEITELIEAAVEFARSSPDPDPKDALEFLYASGMTGRSGAVDG